MKVSRRETQYMCDISIYVYRKAVKVKVKTAVRPAMMFSLETVALSNGQSAELEVKGTKMLGAVWR